MSKVTDAATKLMACAVEYAAAARAAGIDEMVIDEVALKSLREKSATSLLSHPQFRKDGQAIVDDFHSEQWSGEYSGVLSRAISWMTALLSQTPKPTVVAAVAFSGACRPATLEELRDDTKMVRDALTNEHGFLRTHANPSPYFDVIETRIRRLEDLQAASVAGKEK